MSKSPLPAGSIPKVVVVKPLGSRLDDVWEWVLPFAISDSVDRVVQPLLIERSKYLECPVWLGLFNVEDEYRVVDGVRDGDGRRA